MTRTHLNVEVPTTGRNALLRVLGATLFVSPAFALAQGPPPGPGTWSPLYDWSPQLSVIYTTIPPPIPHATQYCEAGPISHAALISTGVHRGKVLIWHAELFRHCPPTQDPQPECDGAIGGVCGPTQKTWMFDEPAPKFGPVEMGHMRSRLGGLM